MFNIARNPYKVGQLKNTWQSRHDSNRDIALFIDLHKQMILQIYKYKSKLGHGPIV